MYFQCYTILKLFSGITLISLIIILTQFGLAGLGVAYISKPRRENANPDLTVLSHFEIERHVSDSWNIRMKIGLKVIVQY